MFDRVRNFLKGTRSDDNPSRERKRRGNQFVNRGYGGYSPDYGYGREGGYGPRGYSYGSQGGYGYGGSSGEYSGNAGEPYSGQGGQGQNYGNPLLGPPRHGGKGPKGFKRSDDRIKEDVCRRLEDHPEIDATDIEVEVTGRAVILTGEVHDRRQRWMVEELSEAIWGVQDVRNELRLSSDRRREPTSKSKVRPKGNRAA